MAATEYAELHCHSAFSLLDGASLPEHLVERAKELGLWALALTDHSDLGGVVRFAQRARELGDYRAIIGLEITVAESEQGQHLTLLARTAHGYANLCRLVTLSRANTNRGRPLLDMAALAEHSSGLLCLSGCSRGLIPRHLQRGDRLGARRIAGQLQDIFQDNLAIEVMDHGLPEEAVLAGQLIGLAQDMNLPWVVTNNVHYARVTERLIHDVLTCLKHGVCLDDAGTILRPNAEWHLKSPDLMAQRWRHDLTGIRNSIALAERCEFRLEQLEAPLPRAQTPDDIDADDHLKKLTWEGARHRWGMGMTVVHHEQLEKELSLIRRRRLAGYFLIMYRIIEFARETNILVQGRGSAANSAVCYCLGITAVDPIRYDLLFERFLSDAREGYPDIDLDIEHNRREEVIQFVYEHYGRSHAAMVCAHTCFRGRNAVRDTARVLGFSIHESTRLAELAHRYGTLEPKHLKEDGFDPEQPRMSSLVRVVTGLRGIPRHRSTHTGGFVLSARPIAEFVGVEPAAMAGRTIIQWDKDDLDAMKIPKFDLLGLGILSAIAEGMHLVREIHGVPAHLYSLPDRQEVYDMIAQADTVGLFQIESRAQMNSLPRTRPRTLYELAIQVALIRPGPLQGDMVHPYIRRKRGEEPIDLIHPSLAPILRRTLGVPLFQEQGMRLAIEAADFSPDEAELLRRAIGSNRTRHLLPGLLNKLEQGLKKRGINDEAAQRVIMQIASFSTYGFPESHSTSFALLVYASAWLKCFHPAEYLCAMLNAQPMGFYSPASLIQDARRHGVEVRPPCLKVSAWHCLMEDHTVRLGLRSVAGLGPKAREKLSCALVEGPFNSAVDVIRRADLPRDALITLAQAGAFSALLSENRRDAVWQILHLSRNITGSLPLGPPVEEQLCFPEQTPMEETTEDFKTMGLTTGVHPMTHIRSQLMKNGVLRAIDLQETKNGQWVKVAGLVISRQRPETAKGFCFVSMEDETGFMNIIVQPKIFERFWPVIVRSQFLEIEGPVSAEQGVWNVKGLRFTNLAPKGAQYTPASHDFR